MAEKLISDVIPSITSSEKGRKALSHMDVYRVSHIPVVDDTKYLGLVSDKLIYDLNLVEVPISTALDKLNTTHAHKDQHIFEVAIVMYKLKISVLPVLDVDHYYLGAITLYDLARRFASLFSLQEVGGVLVIEMNVSDYSVSQISQIVESNDVKILSFFVDRKPGSNVLDVIIKLDSEELSGVVQALMRYDYNVKAVYQDRSMLSDLYKDRFDQFMKFMNI
ncbi:CBS domain-containing protein [Draconibacterium sp. IB214405]|uniref:CBS domain-containing protein n=1 Tax=Draconibacterium sp. IB214405 TaxID=3097352 RepID=UPI002A17BB2B|nr:CBS domain-containing protein [Draconibacterium sp. IB214405]MDX8339204.1 CBS domain-containing protein [Draconibacterium sp. IB214405]